MIMSEIRDCLVGRMVTKVQLDQWEGFNDMFDTITLNLDDGSVVIFRYVSPPQGKAAEVVE